MASPDPIGPAAGPSALPAEVETINLRWLLRLRWVAIASQLVILLAVERAMGLTLPLTPLFVLIGLESASNLACARWARDRTHVPQWVLSGIIAADIAGLTALLYLTGGAVNPFTFLYLVHVTLAAVVLQRPQPWLMLSLALGGYGLLFLLPARGRGTSATTRPTCGCTSSGCGSLSASPRASSCTSCSRSPGRSRSGRGARRSTGPYGASRAVCLVGGARRRRGARAGDAALDDRSGCQGARSQLTRDGADTVTLGDVRLIRQQVDRCRDILARMAADGGETPLAVPLERLVTDAVSGLPPGSTYQITLPPGGERASLVVPVRAVAQALRAVVQNAVQASPPAVPVRLRVSRADSGWQFVVQDDGPGMPAAVLRHAGEPFFTTKPPGHGMGLGLYLARVTVSQLGGRLDLASVEGAVRP